VGLGIKTWLIGGYRTVFWYRLPRLRWKLYGDTSQHGEYLFLRRLIDPSFPRFVVEVGANDGQRNSNSFPFLARGWSGILIEPNPRVFARLQTLYQNNPKVRTLNFACARSPGKLPLFLGRDGEIGEFATLSREDSEYYRATRTDVSIEVTVERLSTLLQQAGCPREFGILSVDTEGFDYEALAGLDFDQHRPRIIITEDGNTDDEAKFQMLRSQGYACLRRFLRNSLWSLQTAPHAAD
jgi:FkbM family methyltransferase